MAGRASASDDGDDDDDVEDVTALFAASTLGGDARRTNQGVHTSLASMLQLAGLQQRTVCGDGNCAYYSAAASAGGDAMQRLRLWPLEHTTSRTSRTPTRRDLDLVKELRRRAVDWLQQPENEVHREVGFSEDRLQWDDAKGGFKPPRLPSAADMEVHRRDGTYATTPILRALAEVLQCRLVSIDSSRLFDRVPVFSPSTSQTVRLRSWRDELAPAIRDRHTTHNGTAAPPLVVIVNNGQMGPGGHFNGTTGTAVVM